MPLRRRLKIKPICDCESGECLLFGGIGMTVYELIQELSKYNVDDEVEV